MIKVLWRTNTVRISPSLTAKRVSIFFAAMLSFVAIDVAVFRSGFYHKFIEPDSSLGVYQFLTDLGVAKISSHGNLVAVIGDSRVHDDFSPQVFDSISGPKGCKALNFGVPASAPRIWYYLLKRVDPNCHAFREIVIALPSYRDVDEIEDFVDRSYDLHYLMPYLSFSDAVELISSYQDPSMKMNAAMQWLVKSFGLREDLMDFCFHPTSRLADLDHSQKCGVADWYAYQGQPHHLNGIKLTNGFWTRGTSDVTDMALQRLNSRVFTPLPQQTGRRQRYNTYWLNKILDRYSASRTKLVFIKVPNDPVPRKCAIPPNYTTINSLKSRPNAIVLPEQYFADFDSPKFFGDEIHLNLVGRKLFSTRLSQYVIGSLDSENALAAASTSQTK